MTDIEKGLSSIKPQNEAVSQAQRLSDFFASDTFIEKVKKFKEKNRNYVTGYVAEYFVVNPDGTGVDNYLDKLFIVDADSSDLIEMGNIMKKDMCLLESVADRLHINLPPDAYSTDGADSGRRLFDYIREHCYVNGKIFPAFNGIFEESIRQHGLDPQRIADREAEKQEIINIGVRHGDGMILGWSGEDFKKTQGKIFTGSSGRNIYSYALASPEWFSQFVAGGTHMSGAWADKSAYARRDYNAAKENLEQYFERRSNATEEDIQAQKAYPNMEESEKVQLRVFLKNIGKSFVDQGQLRKWRLLIVRLLIRGSNTNNIINGMILDEKLHT